jgi:hypothetical protein
MGTLPGELMYNRDFCYPHSTLQGYGNTNAIILPYTGHGYYQFSSSSPRNEGPFPFA